MIASIGKFSKSFLAKVLVAIIALPFILWGMGDVFRSGNQNVIAEINQTKISTKEFMEYLQAVKITKDEIKNKGKENLINEILTNYISERIILMEREEKGIQITDVSLKNILVSDEEFKKEGKFLRTKYEKFLLSKGFSAAQYEKSINEFESKGQLLSYYSGGIKLPFFLVDQLFIRENKSKNISFVDLEKVYSQNKISENQIKELYDKNKEFFKDRFVTFNYLKLSPDLLIGQKNINETYFDKIEEIENQILDGKSFKSISSINKEKVIKVSSVNSNGYKKDGKQSSIKNKFLKEIFKIKNLNEPVFVDLNDEFYIVEVLLAEESVLDLDNKNVRGTIKRQLSIVNVIEENSLLTKKINNKEFGKKEMIDFSKKNKVAIETASIKNINDNAKFDKNLLDQIYNYEKNNIFVISGYPNVKKNYLVIINDEKNPIIDINSENYKKYRKKANSDYISKVYKSYDKYINAIYKIDINNKVLQRLVNSI